MKYVFDYGRLRRRIKLRGLDLKDVSDCCGLTFAQFSRKLSSKYSFKSEEIVAICKLLDIEPDSDDNFCDDLHYFIYELDYGDAKGANEAIEAYGKTWDLSSPEKFYDYLCAMKQFDQILS